MNARREYGSVEFEGKREEDRLRRVSPRSRWPQRENKFLARYPLHFPGYHETGYGVACIRRVEAARRKGHFSHLSSAGNVLFRGRI